MLAHDFGFNGDDRAVVTFVRLLGMALFAISAVLTITSGISYFRKHGHVFSN
jgi:CDP-diacylglycerol--glycerol-3-phosphate 3-phosphatidyltransferase